MQNVIKRDFKILVIEDEDLLRWCIGFQLENMGYEVLLVEDLKEAMSVIPRFEPNLIICDESLPDGRGLRNLKDWRDQSPEAGLVMITAYTLPPREEIAAAKVTACFQKPFDLKDFTNVIEDFYEKNFVA